MIMTQIYPYTAVAKCFVTMEDIPRVCEYFFREYDIGLNPIRIIEIDTGAANIHCSHVRMHVLSR